MGTRQSFVWYLTLCTSISSLGACWFLQSCVGEAEPLILQRRPGKEESYVGQCGDWRFSWMWMSFLHQSDCKRLEGTDHSLGLVHSSDWQNRGCLFWTQRLRKVRRVAEGHTASI